ncbi:MAG TPA: hypothetical protein VIZ86_16425 [Pseudomonas sp.]
MSVLYPRLVELQAQKERADRHIHDEMTRTFLGKRVRVNHHRGSYTGTVTQIYKRTGFSVIVKNDTTGKTTERYPLSRDIHGRPEVELLAGGDKP